MFEPLTEKWAAFGWHVQRVDGNDIPALVAAFDAARALPDAKPRVIICDTRMCKGITLSENREITHFVRVDPIDGRARAGCSGTGENRNDRRFHRPPISGPQGHPQIGTRRHLGHDRIAGGGRL
ncbi:MAG: hypothetical protein U1E55_14680 [Paracoccus sp. (in: a-proteobacteria)]